MLIDLEKTTINAWSILNCCYGGGAMLSRCAKYRISLLNNWICNSVTNGWNNNKILIRRDGSSQRRWTRIVVFKCVPQTPEKNKKLNDPLRFNSPKPRNNSDFWGFATPIARDFHPIKFRYSVAWEFFVSLIPQFALHGHFHWLLM